MRFVFGAIMLLSSFSVLAAEKAAETKRGPASAIKSETVFVKNNQVVSNCINRYCQADDYVNTLPFFGMSEVVDKTISQLDYRKLYSCEARGLFIAGFYKTYDVKNCAELNQRKFLEGISDAFGGGR